MVLLCVVLFVVKLVCVHGLLVVVVGALCVGGGIMVLDLRETT
jgi:hypothetical protein